MFSLELRISNGLIGYVRVVNEYTTPDNLIGCYNVEYYRMGREPPYMKFKIVHNRAESAEKLALLILKEIDKRLKTAKTKKSNEPTILS